MQGVKKRELGKLKHRAASFHNGFSRARPFSPHTVFLMLHLTITLSSDRSNFWPHTLLEFLQTSIFFAFLNQDHRRGRPRKSSSSQPRAQPAVRPPPPRQPTSLDAADPFDPITSCDYPDHLACRKDPSTCVPRISFPPAVRL